MSDEEYVAEEIIEKELSRIDRFLDELINGNYMEAENEQ